MTSLDGIAFLDHTADVGMEVTAPSLEALFRRAAAGMLALLRGADEDDGGAGPVAGEPGAEPGPYREAGAATAARGTPSPGGAELLTLEQRAEDGARLLAGWLKELLFLHETRHADLAGVTFHRLTERVLEARVETAPAAPAVREIKGVTYHGLTVERTTDGWRARVIFDV